MSRSALEYIPRIRAYYKALGYEKPYEWTQVADVPFARLEKPLAEARIGIVTGSSPLC